MNNDDFDQDTLAAIVPLRQAGFALHWLHPREKRPHGNRWSEAAVASLELLQATHSRASNLGVRLGEPSLLSDGSYLHVLDFDIRVPELADDCWAAFKRLFPHIAAESLPSVLSGSGGESRHVYFTTSQPFRSKLLAKSEGKFRGTDGSWHNDWEIELFGTGKQVVLPPSIHPNGKPYVWERPFDFAMLAMGLSPTIPASEIERIGVAKEDALPFESREALDFKPEQLHRILDSIETSELHYDDWVRLGQALHHQFGGSQEGFDLWVKHTKRSAKFGKKERPEQQLREMRRIKWPSFGRYRGAPVTMATIVDWNKKANIQRLQNMFDEEDEVEGGDEQPIETAETPVNPPSVGGDMLDDMFGETEPAPKPKTGKVRETLPGFDDDDEDDGSDDDFNDLKESVKPSIALEWMSLLAVTKDGDGFANHLHNVELIVRNDPRLTGLPQLNEFTLEPVQRTPPGMKGKKRRNQAKEVRQLAGRIWDVKDKLNGDLWSDDRDYAIRSIMEAPQTQGGYGIKVTDRDLKAAIVLAAADSSFHPVREYLEGVVWDGKPRMETLFIDYLGSPDNAYARSVGRNMLLGAVTRIYEPGHKFDFAVILEGLQGKRKSTFIKTLGRNWFAELDGDFHDSKQMIELMQGAWIMEIPELSGFGRADVRAIKAFISRQKDKARLAYAKRAGEFPRQCIFIGSTNDREYLKDDTGGRRFWPMECMLPDGQEIDTDKLSRNVDQIWAEALHTYRAMRAEQPYGDLPLYLVDGEAREHAARLQESRRVESADDATAAQIAAWLDAPINTGSMDDDTDEGGQPLYRNEVCLKQLWVECLGNDARTYNQQAAQMIGRSMALVCKDADWDLSVRKHQFKTYGKSRFYSRFGDVGYRERMGFLA